MIEILHANVLDVDLGDMADIDVMITDPPYSEHVHKSAVSQRSGGGVDKRDLNFGHLTPRVRSHVGRLAGAVKRWSVLYGDVEGQTWWRIALSAGGAKYIRAIPWIRWSMPQLSGDRPPTGCEMLTVAWGSKKGKKSWNGPGNLTHFSHKCLRGEGKHKCEKPLDQALDLVEFFSDPGETVFDPFAGSGVIGLACKILGRNYIGVELDPEWAERARVRVALDRLGDRDAERKARWDLEHKARQAEMARMKETTARTRARYEQEQG